MNNSEIVPRRLNVEFDADMPRHWCGGSPFMTHMLNVYTLLVPDNELYYIRHINRMLDRVEDPALQQRIRDFCRQEAQHGSGHRAFWDVLDAQGVRYRRFVGFVGWFNYRLLEPLIPRRLHLANIACIEHINAYLGNLYLERDLLREAEPRLRLLFNWHFAEEIEHKCVAYDAFVAAGGTYFQRVLGALLVVPLFYLINTGGTFYLLAQEGQLLRRRTWRDIGRFLFRDGALVHALRNLAAYFKPGFDPTQVDDFALAQDFFAQLPEDDDGATAPITPM